jgi:molecular chaperone GrpE
MDFNNEIEDTEIITNDVEEGDSLSIEDFIKELEAKEKDLHISSDLSIEIDDADFDDTNPDFIRQEFPSEPVKSVEVAAPAPVNRGGQEKLAAEFEEKLSQMNTKVSKLETERADLAETIRRRQIDFDNFKKRTERDRRETYLNQVSNLAKQMLPVLDNLNRALDFASDHSKGRSADFHQFFEGIILVNQQLNDVLAEMGVSPIASVGERFDPHYHEAVATEISENRPPNTVTGELLRGYRIGDKVIRAAMVKVSIAGVSPSEKKSSPEGNPNSEDDLLDME